MNIKSSTLFVSPFGPLAPVNSVVAAATAASPLTMLVKFSPDVCVDLVMTPILSPDSVKLAKFALTAYLQGRAVQVHADQLAVSSY